MFNKRLWRGAVAVFGIILSVIIGLGTVAFINSGFVNGYLGTKTSAIVEIGEGEDIPTDYYKSDYGDVNALTKADAEKLIADESAFAVREMEEGAVLLKNSKVGSSKALPLSASERNVTLFGRAVADPVYKGYSNGGAREPRRQVSLYSALKSANFTLNETLYDAYTKSATARTRGMGFGPTAQGIGEEKAAFYTQPLKDTFAAHSDAAIVMLSRDGGEMADLCADGDIDGVPQLSFHQDEKDLLQIINDSGVFEKIILLVNSPYAMDLGWLDEYNVDAALWIGGPGLLGFTGVVNILTGAANPSGRLVDTYAADSLSSAAMQNFGDFTFTNAAAVEAGTTDGAAYTTHYLVYAEGVYVGYKYYETRYEDCILGRYGASSNAGMFASSGPAWNYADEIVYPFGFGLSYTTFEQTLVDFDARGETVKATVKVKNTGDKEGKSVVQFYGQTPYDTYEKENYVEKPAVQIFDFAKTDILKPDGEQTVTLEVDKYLLASYDYKAAKGYVLSNGDYYFAIGDDAHNALNNILAAKQASGMFDQNGAAVPGNADKVKTWNNPSVESGKYRFSEQTGEEVTNQFDDADLNYWVSEDEKIDYLTRQDWKNTFPKPVTVTATADMIEAIDCNFYEKPADAPSISAYTQGTKKGVNFIDMKDAKFDADVWDEFIDQLSIEDMAKMTFDQLKTPEIISINMPDSINNDGPDGVQGKYLNNDDLGFCTCYNNEVVAASTWSKELLARRGYFLGEDALFAGQSQIWSPGANLHRTPYGGRNFEYYSEDAIFSYICSVVQTEQMLKKGLNVAPKHFAGNDQETWRCGVSTFMTEQAWREGPLKAFEGMFTEVKVHGTMSSYSRIGCTTTSSSYATLTQVLRNEWGFEGTTITDNAMQPYFGYQHTLESLVAGSDQFCMSDRSQEIINAITKNDDGHLLGVLRESAHRHIYAYLRSNLINGMSPNSRVIEVIPWWVSMIVTFIVVLSVLTAASVALFIVSMIKQKNGKA